MTDGQEINRYKLENADLKKRCEEAEGELAIMKVLVINLLKCQL